MSEMARRGMSDKARRTASGIARRGFLISAGVLGGGLLVGAGATAYGLRRIDGYKLPVDGGRASFGAWLRMASDGVFEVMVPHQEMGQGIHTLAMLLAAEELRVPLTAMRAVAAPDAAIFANPVMLLDGLPMDPHSGGLLRGTTLWTLDKLLRLLGVQGTGGSSSTRNIETAIRQCAIVALDMLRRAAAEEFGVNVDQITAQNGILSASNGRAARYGDLAAAAGKLSPNAVDVPALVPGRLVGRPAARADAKPKTIGAARFGIDTRLDGQLYAAIRHAPRLGGRPQTAQLGTAVAGVRHIVTGTDYVAVIATSFAAALAGLDGAQIVWDDRAASRVSTSDVIAGYRGALDQGAGYKQRWVIEHDGDPADGIGRKISGRYYAPFLAHTTMEPINATALVTSAGVTVWAGHQSLSLAKFIAARAAGVEPDAVEVHTPYLGGGFGRRADLHYIRKAVEIASIVRGVPVQTIWTRPEDLRDDVYRPAAMADVSATLGEDGMPTSLSYRIAVPSVTDQFTARAMPAAKGGLLADRSVVDGAVFSFYELPNRRIEHFAVDLGIPVGFWRSVGHSLGGFFFETFIDELAVAAGVAPMVFRARLLSAAPGVAADRAEALLQRLATWDIANRLPAVPHGTLIGRGVALSECFHSFVAQIAEVEVTGSDIRVRRVHAVVDCGCAIDPNNTVAQIRSGINYGLSAALFGRIDFDNGAVVQSNFHDYPALTLDTAPEISVEIVNSNAPIGGVGEIGTPGIAPAVGNAIFAATGKRLRSLPFAL